MAEPTLDSLTAHNFPSDQYAPRRNRHFSVSVVSSADSSRASSPAALGREKYPSTRDGEGADIPGRQIDMYDATLHWWRAAIRRSLVKSVQWESEAIARMQVSRFLPLNFDQLYAVLVLDSPMNDSLL